ncbi:MAG: Cytochrome c-type biosis protein CcmH/NrfG, partial [Verrucomicrobiaceae bacterium]|nr:Cytochrome c-type biosis protein CcmH/NrfG [Verrucomicrobiaceae bacterium]
MVIGGSEDRQLPSLHLASPPNKAHHVPAKGNCTMSKIPHSFLTLVVALLLAVPAPGETPQAPAAAWAERDTRLANEYLSMLVDQPEYGRVVDLLWDLYRKHDSTKLLLDNIHAQAAASNYPSVLLVEAHLVRKSGDLKQAASLYDAVLKKDPASALATKGRAEVAAELGDSATALTLLRKLAAGLPDTDPAKVDAWMQLGNAALTSDHPDEAATAWETAAKLKPQDMNLARNVAQLMLRAGHPERAATFLEALAKQSDPQKKLEALFDLARVREHSDAFPKADEALRQGLALLDFRDGRYADFFRRRVRLHERFGALEDLRNELIKAARTTPPTEQALYDLARYYGITVDPEERVSALRELTKAAPNNDQYRWELVRSLLDHDGSAEAAKLLDEKVKNDGSDIPVLIQLRAEADLRQGRQAEAVARLNKLLDAHKGDVDVEKALLAFSQERSLDGIIEAILKRRIERDPNKPEFAFELASFYRSRDNTTQAVDVLKTYAHLPSNSNGQARRLNDAAQFLATGGALEEALKLQGEAATLSPGNRDELIHLADLLAESGNSTKALENLEAALPKATTDEEVSDIDDRIFSVLQGDRSEKVVKKSAATSTGFQLPAFMTGQGFGTDDPPEVKSKTKFPPTLIEYAMKIIEAAKLPDASERQRYRAVWWAFHIERTADSYEILRLLAFDPATQARRELPLEVDKLMLDVAISDENRFMARVQLQKLVERDPANRVQYLLRLAEQHLADNQPDLAVKLLEQALKLQPDGENILTALTQCYQVMRKPDKALALWRDAISRTPGNGGTPLRERYAELLLKAGKLNDYVETQVAIVESETDIKRRREAFKRFLDRLVWSDASGGEAASNIVQERLKLVEQRIQERTRRHPFDGFFHEALAAVYEKHGDAAKAF